MVNFQDWWKMIPDTKRVVVVGETGNVPRSFQFQNFNLQFPMNFEQYTGVITVEDKQYFMIIKKFVAKYQNMTDSIFYTVLLTLC